MSIAKLSRFVLRHKLFVAMTWLVVVLAAFAFVGRASGALSTDFSMPGSESTTVNQALARTYGNGGQTRPLVAVFTLPAGTTVDSPAVQNQLQTVFGRIQQAAPDARIVSYVSTGDHAFVSKDGRTTYGLIFPQTTYGGETVQTDPIKTVLAQTSVGGSHGLLTGLDQLESGGGSGGGTGVLAETMIGGLGALIVLAWVFGSLLAFLPLLIAVISILTTFLVIWGVTTVTEVSGLVEFLIALIGLGIAIDYSLLIVTRWREERAAGRDNEAAVQRAMETAGHAVLFSGFTVTVGLLSLIVLPVGFLRSIGIGGMLIPLVSLVVALTLLPVLLATIGPRLDWPRRRRGNQVSALWAKWTGLVVRRRIAAAVVALLILAALVIPAFSLRIGYPTPDAMANTGEAHDGVVALERAGLSDGVLTPFEALVKQGDPNQVATALGRVKGVATAVAPSGDSWRRDGTAIVVAIPAQYGDSNAGHATLERVRDTAHALPGQVLVGGSTATMYDFINAVYGSFPLMLGLVILITSVLLVVAFRSVFLPLKAVALNALSIGAAYGVLVLVWQDGYGSEAIWGITASGAITNWLPIMVFAFLFGLSMDYEVFILSRIREEYDRTGSTDQAVVRGMSHTGKLVTTAALILFLAFAALASAPNTSVKIFATGLAAGILIDATVIRALLVPAAVSLMGHWNWWLPSWLERRLPAAPHPDAVAEPEPVLVESR